MKRRSVYRLLLFTRFATIFIPLSSYIHPDEFFQSSEVIAGDIFQVEVYQPWEFQRNSPIRTTAFSYITCGLPFYFLKYISAFFERFFGLSCLNTYSLLIAPRIVVTLLSLLIDYSIYKMCFFYHKEHLIALLILSSSYITYTYHGRPFSNTIEAILFSALLYYVLKSFHQINTLYASIRPVDVEIANPYNNKIAAITVAGVFNRPTFVLFAITPIVFWIQYGFHSTASKYKLMFLRTCSLVHSAVITTLLFVLWDSFYYDRMVLDDLLDIRTLVGIFNKFLWTPLNFIKYNGNVHNLSEHGLHPPWLHTVVHLPMLFANLALHGIFGYWQMIYNLIKKGQFDIIDPLTAMMTCSFVVPVLLLSIFPHQEPRFLTPLLIPLVFLHNDKVWKKRYFSFMFWLLANLLMYLLYGFIHQGGLIPSLRYATNIISESDLKEDHHLVFFHTYMPPRHLMTVPLSDKRLFFHDLGGANRTKLKNDLLAIDSTNSNIILFSPDTLDQTIQNLNKTFHISIMHQFWPHLSTEDFPKFESSWYFLSSFKNFLCKFTFNIYSISNKNHLE